jgi:hypothetical protein
MWFVLASAPSSDEGPGPWADVGAVTLLAVVDGVVLTVLGYRAAALPPGVPPDLAAARSQSAYRTSLFVRLACAEVPLLVSMALAFVSLSGGFAVVLVGVLASVLLIVIHAWPTVRSVDLVAEGLERSGTRCYLRESLGLLPHGSGAAPPRRTCTRY